MKTAPYAHPQHMKVVNHLSYVVRGCENHSMFGKSLSHCIMVSCITQQGRRILPVPLCCQSVILFIHKEKYQSQSTNSVSISMI